MHPRSLMTLDEAASLLGVSRPTLNARRDELDLTEVKVQRHTKLLRAEVLERAYASAPPLRTDVNLTMLSEGKIEDLMIDSSSFDLRRLNLIDGIGVLSLLVKVRNLVDSGEYVYLLLGEKGMASILCRLGFFKEIRRVYKTQVGWNADMVTAYEALHLENAVFPIKYIGIKGQEREFLEELKEELVHQEFSEDICSYITWVLGELADNAHTHAKGPCYFLIDRIGDKRLLEVAMADFGVGIDKSLVANPKYESLNPVQALVTSFKAKVSSWPDEAERGKGLSDVFRIAMGNQGYLRAESNEVALFMNFNNYQTDIQLHKPLTSAHGTRFSIMFIDSQFEMPSRQDADLVIEKWLKGGI